MPLCTTPQDWEGGVRVIGAVGGGFMDPANGAPVKRRLGSKLGGITHGCDWYATFAALAGQSWADPRAAAAGLHPPDAVNLWPYLSGAVDASPRTRCCMSEGSQCCAVCQWYAGAALCCLDVRWF